MPDMTQQQQQKQHSDSQSSAATTPPPKRKITYNKSRSPSKQQQQQQQTLQKSPPKKLDYRLTKSPYHAKLPFHTRSASVNKRSRDTAQNKKPFVDITKELKIEILEFYGGYFGSLEGSQKYIQRMIRMYYGRIDGTIHFLYPYCDIEYVSKKEVLYLLPLLKRQTIDSQWFKCLEPPKGRRGESEVSALTPEIEEFLKRSETTLLGFTSLNLVQVETGSDLLKTILECTKNIKSLRCGVRQFPRKDHRIAPETLLHLDVDVAEAIGKLQHLEEFEWYGSGLSDEGLTCLSQHLKSIKIFKVHSYSLIGAFHNIFASWSNLEFISINYGFTNKGSHQNSEEGLSVESFNAIASLQNLKLLRLHHCGDISASEITPLTGHMSLRFIDINSKLCSEAFTVFGSIPNLKVLLLNNSSGYKRSDLSRLAPLKDVLEVFNADQSSNFGNIGCQHIIKLKSLRSVWLRNLSQDQIQDEGARLLALLPNLEEIDLSYCSVSELTIKQLVKNCSSLKRIYLAGTRLDVNKLSQEEKNVVSRDGPTSIEYHGISYNFNPKNFI
jgi:hypothetical protein